MQHISNLIPERKETKITSQRQFIISQFVEEINSERSGTKWKPCSPRSIAVKLSVLKTTHELEMFLSECRDYKRRNGSFSKRFFGGFRKRA